MMLIDLAPAQSLGNAHVSQPMESPLRLLLAGAGQPGFESMGGGYESLYLNSPVDERPF